MTCKNCGEQLPENVTLCPKCGTDNSETAEMSAVEGERSVPHGFSSKKNIIIIIVIAVLLIIGSVTAIAVTNYNSVSNRATRGIELAERYLNEQNYEQAIIEFQKVLEIEPMNVDAYLGLANVYEEMGDVDKAAEILQDGLEKTGDERIQQRNDELLKQEEESTNTSAESESVESETTASMPAESETTESEPNEDETEENDNSQQSSEYSWTVKPSYDFDNVEMIKLAFCCLWGEGYLSEPVNNWDGFSYVDVKAADKITGIYVIEKNGKQGMVDLNGNQLTDIIFDKIGTTPDGVFSFVIDSGNLYTPNTEYSIDTNYNLSAPQVGFGGYSPVTLYNAFDDKVYWFDAGIWEEVTNPENNFLLVVHGTNVENIKDVKCEDDDWDSCKKGLYCNGKLVVPLEYDFTSSYGSISSTTDSQYERFVFSKDNKIYVFDQNGKCYSDGIYSYKDNGKQEISYVNGYLPVCKDDRWGLIDVNGNEVISCQFEDITSVYDGKAWAKQNGKWGVIEINLNT